jgi:hypothetical protein
LEKEKKVQKKGLTAKREARMVRNTQSDCVAEAADEERVWFCLKHGELTG